MYTLLTWNHGTGYRSCWGRGTAPWTGDGRHICRPYGEMRRARRPRRAVPDGPPRRGHWESKPLPGLRPERQRTGRDRDSHGATRRSTEGPAGRPISPSSNARAIVKPPSPVPGDVPTRGPRPPCPWSSRGWVQGGVNGPLARYELRARYTLRVDHRKSPSLASFGYFPTGESTARPAGHVPSVLGRSAKRPPTYNTSGAF